ncbi:MAG: hypothetical protein GC186_09875 [Rhodobacteraceae bacterium]|nr:hypothetical protein [Paracoccaceae bacterium]
MARIPDAARLTPRRTCPTRTLIAALLATLPLAGCGDGEASSFIHNHPALMRLMTSHQVEVVQETW